MNRQGNNQLVDSRGYTYNNHGRTKSKTYWECTKRTVFKLKCKAKVCTIDSKIVKFTNDHNHLPPSADKA